MFPLRDDNPTCSTSFATYAIIGINILVWIGLQGMGSNPALQKSICNFGLIPGELLGITKQGVQVALSQDFGCILSGEPNWTTVISSMFMHGGWLHLIFNMWFLAIFGDNVEDAMGPIRFVSFYLLCGLGAVAVHMASNPSSPLPLVGASGAIGGVMGAYALLFPRVPVHMLVLLGFFLIRIVVPAYFMLGYWFILQFLSALPTIGTNAGGVAFWAHIGGFITGLLLTKPFCNKERLAACSKKKGRTSHLVERVR